MPETPRDDFYIGWEEHMPAGHARFLRAVLFVVALVGLGLAATFAALQRPFAVAFFEFGAPRAFEGTVVLEPSPRLVVDAPGGAVSSWSLVGVGKHGAEADVAAFDSRRVRLEGTLVYRDDRTMLEIVAGSVEAADGPARATGARVDHGRHAIEGEIVDSKCFYGVMKPGFGKPHRACASLCIRGGIPPVLVVRDESGTPTGHFLLTGKDGAAIHREILDFVAEPVRVTGQLYLDGDVWRLEIEPSAIERIGML